MSDIKDGDIYRWRYKDEKPDDLGPWLRYHCKSQIAIANNGRLTDTFWFSNSEYSASWKYDEVPERLVLNFLGNLGDLDHKPEYMFEYYDEADCVDLNHSNSSKGNFYILKGAKRSEAKMREIINQKIKEEMGKIRCAQSHIECLEKSLSDICAGKPLDGIYL